MSKSVNDGALVRAYELSDAELAQVQGGGIFGDAWDWVKDKASDVADGVKHAVTHPIETLGKLARGIEWIIKNYPRKSDPRRPSPLPY